VVDKIPIFQLPESQELTDNGMQNLLIFAHSLLSSKGHRSKLLRLRQLKIWGFAKHTILQVQLPEQLAPPKEIQLLVK